MDELWCELVMNGIGGCTIAQAQQQISHREFIMWVQYRNKRGSLNAGQRVEFGNAMLASLYANAHSKHGGLTVYDFAPHHDAPALTLDQAMKQWA